MAALQGSGKTENHQKRRQPEHGFLGEKGMTSLEHVRAGHVVGRKSGLGHGRRGRGRFLLLFRSGSRFLARQENLADADGGVRLAMAVAALVALAAAEL